jgi:IMP dehydrogenase
MENKIIDEAYTFDDVSLIPGIAEVPVSEIDLATKATKNTKLKIPILSAAMDTVSEAKMAIALSQMGGLSIIHRNLDIQEQAEEVKKVKTKNPKIKVGAAVGTSGDYLERVEALIEEGVDIICIDLAHGSTVWGKNALKAIKSKFKVEVIAGNVVTKEGAEYLAEAGADAIKVGIGGGSICTTRIVTGTGVPNLTAIFNVKPVTEKYKIPLIIDGGIRYSGDVVKALAAGADAAMCGNVLAGTDQSPGEIMEINKEKYKTYRGMGSEEAANKRVKDRYYDEKSSKKVYTSQGVSGMIKYKGDVRKILEVFTGGIKSGMEVVGVKDVANLQEKARFYKVSNSGTSEAHPHNLNAIKNETNYSK